MNVSLLKKQKKMEAIFTRIQEIVPVDYVAVSFTNDHMEDIEYFNLVNISFPQEWVDTYKALELFRHDPITREFRVRAGMQFCEDTFKNYTDASNYMSLCRDFRVDKGYSFGFVSNGITCLLDFASPIMKRSQYTETILKYITPHFDQALRRIFLQNSTKIILTPGEQEILKWISSGKQNWDISVILSISIETIKFHVKNICKKLGATNRAEALVMAIQNNLIRLETFDIQAFVKESARS